MVTSTVGNDKAGNDSYQNEHMRLIFQEGFSFSGFERNTLFLNRKGRSFMDISGISGADSIADGRAAVVADFDNDGDSDMFVTNIQGEAHQLFRNNLGSKARFLRVSVEGTDSGPDAFGATVRLKSPLGIQTRVKSGGNGFMAQHDPRLLFGLGGHSSSQWLEVRWPSGRVQRFDGPESGRSVRVVEGDPKLYDVTESVTRLADPVDPDLAVWSKLSLQPGGGLPALDLLPLKSTDSSELQELKRGKGYLVNFWATFCGPCLKEMPELERLRPKLEAAGYQIVGVALDEQGFERVQAFADRLGVTYPLFKTNKESIARIFKTGEVFIPFSILIDPQGHVQDILVGWSPAAEEKILKLLPAETR